MSEITKSPDKNAFSNDRAVWLLLAALAVAVYFWGLGMPLVGPDEPRYAQVAREMFERGDWVTTTLGGFTWFEKPALLYWLQIVFYHVFGVTEFAARLGSALFGLGTVVSLWLLGRFAVRPIASAKNTANWLALIGASTLGLIVFAHGASFDIILTFPMTAALVGFFVFDSAQPADRPLRIYLPLAAFYFFVGVALLAKGLVGIIFPGAIVCFYYLLSWKLPSRSFVFSLLWGGLITLAAAATWYVPVFLQNGYSFIDEFFIQHHFQRYTSNKYLHPQPFIFFFWVLPLMTLPWLPFFLAAVWKFVPAVFSRQIREDGDRTASELSLIRFAVAWTLVPLVFFSFSGSKLPGYILPAVPATVVLTALFVARLIMRRRKLVHWFQAVAAATFVVVICLFIFAVPQFADADSVKSLIAAADTAGFGDSRVLSMHTVSHNAEFYAAGRLVREADGKQRKFLGPLEVLDEIRREGGRPVLVLVPVEHVSQLTESADLNSQVIKTNTDLAIVVCGAKQ